MRSRFVFRIVASGLAISFLLLALGGFSGWYVLQQQTQASKFLTESVIRMRTAEEIVSVCRNVRFQLAQLSITGDPSFLEAVQPILETLPDQLSRSETLAASDEERDLLKRVHDGHVLLQTELKTLATSPPAERRSKANEIVHNIVTDLMVTPAERYLEASDSVIDHSSRRNQAIAGRVALGFLLLGVCGAVAGLVAGHAIARGVRHTLFQLHVPLRTATGKLEEVIGPIDLDEPKDLRDLDSTLERLADRVAMVVDRFQESQRELLRAEQLAALGQLAAGLAHELRNPLTSIKILVQTAAEAGDAARLEGRDVAVLEEELTRLEESIQRFLDFAKPPSLEKQRFDIRQVIWRILDLLSARAAQQQVRLQSTVPETPVEIWADREQVRQLLLNTLLNALDAVGHGGEIHLNLASDGEFGGQERDKIDAETRRWATVTVVDNGPGIPDVLGNRIFEPFVSTKDTGLGLGLAICRRIAEAHNGHIHAANTSHGTEFSIHLPLGAPLAGTPSKG